MIRSLKNKGSVFSASNPNKEEQRHAEKIKNIERMIIADFKIFIKGVFYGFSKRKSVKSRRVSQSHDQRQSGGG
ncbi:hypothetical protein HpBhutan199_14150 [Helicobacter pylori]